MIRSIGSERMRRTGAAIFAEVAAWKAEAVRAGLDVIDLSIGSPDRPPSERVRRKLAEAVMRPDAYGYPSSQGSTAFRRTAARWMKHRFGVELDPDSEIVALMGSQDGLAHAAVALTDPGDPVLVPDPGYPIYTAGVILAGAVPVHVPLRPENGFLPDLAAIPDEVRKRARYMLLNYPGNPLSVVADESFFRHWLAFSEETGIPLLHDLAYSEMAFDGIRPKSLLELPGAIERAAEFHSLSKSFNMAGCRIGFLAGNREIVAALKSVKSNVDYGVFGPIQEAAIEALEEDMEGASEPVAPLYERRRNVLVAALREGGWIFDPPQATMFLWAPVPEGWTSRQISREILENTGVAVVPGDAFGPLGEGCVRIALVQEEERLAEAGRRLARFWRERIIDRGMPGGR
ncbi:aminotransferase class I/II-fold pyridoxal phosphate-dependent enzyme [Paenibacillus thermoaerophilus]|uniref:Aminotransferase n=1 Tax=Paenibacillus thermoaerophilus TaxID=1215385 RepID=A0ABW2V5W6_9BACL|nr:aminotransferase class I/II-fold pyridoxal phosphate-dependent enzyme [Paenibacillus thermoaerophilus]TMV18499.1 aminotransferase class I/II-fold pyridoxal phosphate-dependent enzyme [Paenibacillus thermoaerophilus]